MQKDKFEIKQKFVYFVSFIFFMKLRLNFQLIVFCYKKYCTGKDEKVTCRQHTTK